ncbi:MAG: PIG-L family deacetylase [Syntrophomonadaceae bacterium]|nr:PIG-L family deacetylase [Syntrophomonadaceae bacterium]
MIVLIVAAHPDDEVLGCGGSIAKHIHNGDEVHVYLLSEGLTSRYNRRDREKRAEELSALAQAAREANRMLGVSSLALHDFPDNRMDSVDLLDVVKMVEKSIDKHKPDIVYTHHAGDVNIDHRIVHQAVTTACRPLPAQCVQTLLFFEVPSSTEWQTPGSAPPFLPNYFVNISNFLDKKLMALEAYQSEMRSWPHSRSVQAIEHLARWRGAMVGVEAAEGFMLGKKLIT